ncbi:hypothetical protein ABQF34_29970 [Mycolicibacterium boenickei]
MALGKNATANSTHGFFNSAVALGPGASAQARGVLNRAWALGPNTKADPRGVLNSAIALGNGAISEPMGVLNSAWAVGNDSVARTFGSLNFALAAGTTGGANNTTVKAGTTLLDAANVAITLGNDSLAETGDVFAKHGYGNIALNAGRGGNVVARGVRNTAVNLGGNSAWPNNTAWATGVANRAVNIGGNGNFVQALGGDHVWQPGLNTAFNLGGNKTKVNAGQFGTFRPLSVAGTAGGNLKKVVQATTGINIK